MQRRNWERALEAIEDLLRSLLRGESPPMLVEDRPGLRAGTQQAEVPWRFFTTGCGGTTMAIYATHSIRGQCMAEEVHF